MKILYAIIFTFLVVSCNKEQFYPFPWVKGGNTITYNFISDSISENAALIFEVGANDYTDQLRFQFTYPLWTRIPDGGYVGHNNYRILRKPNGIHKLYSENCGFGGPIFSSDLNSLRIPAKPHIGDSYVEYSCGNNIDNIHKVIEFKEVTVPMGTFSTFVMQDSLYLKKEYWNEKNGLILIENYDKNGNVIGRYEAAFRNF